VSVLGIDFGTTNSSMAWPSQQGERVDLVRDAEGNEKTPSVVYFGDDETLVGTEAVNVLVDARGDDLVQARVIQSVKRRLLNPPRIALPGGRAVRPVEVAAEILAKLRRDAEANDHGERLARAVITYPAVFDAAQTSAIVEAATMAGFDEVELVEEPVAAAIAFQHEGGQVGQGVLVFDYGGGTFDAAFVVREEGEDRFYLALEPDGDAQCGGDDIDQALYDYFDAQARSQLGRPITLRDNTVDTDFLQTCRRRKETLSKSRQATFSTMLDGGVRFSSTIDRAAFEELISSQVDRTVRITERTAQRAREAGYPVDTVLLVGGSSQVPLVQQRITGTLGLQPLSWGHRDVAVALGAAYYAQVVWGRPVRRQPTQDDPRQRYQRSVELVWSDGRLEPAEAQRLETFRRELGLSPEDAAQIERQVIGRAKEEFFDPGPAQPGLQPGFEGGGAFTGPSASPGPDLAGAVANQVRRAEAHRYNRRLEEAIAAFNRALEIDPTSEEALTGRAEVYFSLHRFDEARADLNQVLDRNPNFYRALVARARVNAEQFRVSEGYDDASRAIELDPGASEGFVAGGWIFSVSDAAESALGSFERALELDPMSVDGLVGRGLAKLSLGRDEQAKIDFNRALELDPKYVPALVGQARAHMDELPTAIVMADQALELDPKAPRALSVRGFLDLLLELLPDATRRFDAALAINPDWVPAMQGRAQVAFLEGRPADAVAEFDRGMELAPHSADLSALRGISHQVLENYLAAIEDYDRAISHSESLSVASEAFLHVWRGQAKVALQRSQDAMEDFDKAIELESELAAAYLERAKLHLAADDTEKSLADADKAVTLNPTTPENRTVRAAALAAFLRFILGPRSTEQHWPPKRTGNFAHGPGSGRRTDLNRRLLGRAELEDGWKDDQKQALVNALNGTEAVIWLCRCARTIDTIRQVALVVTSERLIWCRKTMFGSGPELGKISYNRITSVDDAPEGFALKGREASTNVGFAKIRTGVDLSGLKLSLDGTDV
jgi:tetratricopeptide (TPR) repeat protein